MKKINLLKVSSIFILCISLSVPLSGCTAKDKEIVIAENVKENLNSTNAEILQLIEEGNSFLKSGKFSEAKASFEKAISKDKTNEGTYIKIKENYMNTNRFDDAYYIIKLAIDNNISTDKMGKILEEIKTKFTTIQLEDTINQGSDYSLPNQRTIPVDTIPNPVNIRWNQKNIDTSNPGTFTFDGYIDEYGRTVQLELTVREVVKQTKEVPAQSKEVEKKAASTPITYKSSALGIAFDMPANWENNYLIKDNEKEIKVYMKHDSNVTPFLFTITSDLQAYGNGEFINNINGEQYKTINGKQYLIGGPTGLALSENDPKLTLYLAMLKDVGNIMKSLRAV